MAPFPFQGILGLLLIAAAVHYASGCVHEYGTAQEAGAAAGAHFTYSYNGLDWPNSFQACRGRRQSPVMLPTSGAAAAALTQPSAKSSFSYSPLKGAKVVNNGHTLQVSLPEGFTSDVKIPIKGARATATGTSVLTGSGDVSYVKATPAQFHFHSHSEHLLSGAEYPMEMHIVHFIKPDQLPACKDKGCPVVLAAMVALTDKEDGVKPELRALIEAMPLNEGASATLTSDIHLNTMMPSDGSYFTYEGSLTTPPCTEGILWHVLKTPIKISQSLLTKYEEAVGDLYCPDKKSPPPTELETGPRPAFKLPPKDKRGCIKLANGHNCRAIQPTNGRPIMMAT